MCVRVLLVDLFVCLLFKILNNSIGKLKIKINFFMCVTVNLLIDLNSSRKGTNDDLNIRRRRQSAFSSFLFEYNSTDLHYFIFRFVFPSIIIMKGIIGALALLAIELTTCLLSSRWHFIDVNNSQICFKPFLQKYQTNVRHHQFLNVGPIYSTRTNRFDRVPHHFMSNHGTIELPLLIAGVALIFTAAIALSIVEFCAKKFGYKRYHMWLHLINVTLLTISLILLIVGFYLLQHFTQQPLNGAAALGFFIGILFIVVLVTFSGREFWTYYAKTDSYDIVKLIN